MKVLPDGKVFVALHNSYDDIFISGVYTTRKAAHTALQKRGYVAYDGTGEDRWYESENGKTKRGGYDAVVEEHEVDA